MQKEQLTGQEIKQIMSHLVKALPKPTPCDLCGKKFRTFKEERRHRTPENACEGLKQHWKDMGLLF